MRFWKPFSLILLTVINYSLLLRPQAKWPTWNCRTCDINQMRSWTRLDTLQNAPCKLSQAYSKAGPTTVGRSLSFTFPAACILLNQHFLGYIIIVTPKRIFRETVTPMSETHLHLWLAGLCQHVCACFLHTAPNGPPVFSWPALCVLYVEKMLVLYSPAIQIWRETVNFSAAALVKFKACLNQPMPGDAWK